MPLAIFLVIHLSQQLGVLPLDISDILRQWGNSIFSDTNAHLIFSVSVPVFLHVMPNQGYVQLNLIYVVSKICTMAANILAVSG